MHPISFFAAFFCVIGSLSAAAQRVVLLEVELTKPLNGLEVPAKINLDAVTSLSESTISLVEVQGTTRIPVPFQIENKESRTLYWMVNAENDKIKKRTYELVKTAPSKNSNLIEATTKDGTLLIHSGDKNLLQYNFKEVYPPIGIDTAFKRSAFIHPLWTPTG